MQPLRQKKPWRRRRNRKPVEVAQAGGGGPGQGGGGGRPDASMIAGFVMTRSDTNSDGKLDKDEIANLDERSKGWAGTADTNGDGDISKEEVVKAMKKVMKSRGGGGGRPGGGGGRPGGGGR